MSVASTASVDSTYEEFDPEFVPVLSRLCQYMLAYDDGMIAHREYVVKYKNV